ncbi:MAG: vWA domain-containing protein [Nannocystales bacterium]
MALSRSFPAYLRVLVAAGLAACSPLLACTVSSAGDTDTGTDTDGSSGAPAVSEGGSGPAPTTGGASASGGASSPSPSGEGGASSDSTGSPAADACTRAELRCSADGTAQQACGWDTDEGANRWGEDIPCNGEEVCVAGRCVAAACRVPELLFVVDRSDSLLANGDWSRVSGELEAFSQYLGNRAEQGLRMFPSAGCEPGDIEGIATRWGGLAASIDPPTTDSATPLTAGLQGLAPAFGDPNQAQAVILLTDGGESCADDAAPELDASSLFAAGVRVYTVGVSDQADFAVLDQIAAAGGTVVSRQATEPGQIDGVLEAILDDLGACACPSAVTQCVDGIATQCSEDGSEIGNVAPCPSGSCAFPFGCEDDALFLTCQSICALLEEQPEAASCVSEIFLQADLDEQGQLACAPGLLASGLCLTCAAAAMADGPMCMSILEECFS